MFNQKRETYNHDTMTERNTVKQRNHALLSTLSKLPIGFMLGVGAGVVLFIANEKGKEKIAKKNKAVQLAFRVGKVAAPYLLYNLLGMRMKKGEK